MLWAPPRSLGRVGRRATGGVGRGLAQSRFQAASGAGRQAPRTAEAGQAWPAPSIACAPPSGRDTHDYSASIGTAMSGIGRPGASTGAGTGTPTSGTGRPGAGTPTSGTGRPGAG